MKVSLLNTVVFAAIASLTVGCTLMERSGGDGGADDNASAGSAGFDQAYQEAESALKKAVEANNVWSTTEDLISEAKAAAEKKDFETAISLANRVKFESEAAYEQQTSQQKAGPTLF